MLTSLSRFVAKSAQHALPFFKLLRKETAFEWTDECETALTRLKRALSQPPILSRPDQGETLYLYLSVSSDAVSTVLIIIIIAIRVKYVFGPCILCDLKNSLYYFKNFKNILWQWLFFWKSTILDIFFWIDRQNYITI